MPGWGGPADYNRPLMTSCPFSLQVVRWADAADRLSAVRMAVFVHEQGVPAEIEVDELDPLCIHVLAIDATGVPMGTGRLLPDGHIGRMAVLGPWRRKGVGAAMLDTLLGIARERGDREAILHAQTHACDFYRHAGFEVTSAEFMEAGIVHVEMRCRLVAPPESR